MSKRFREEIRSALANPILQEALDANAQRRVAASQAALASLPEDWHILRSRAHGVRTMVVESLDEHLAEFAHQAQINGIIVHHAVTAQDAINCVLAIAEENQAKLIAKSKSMVSEEINLNQALEANGYRVVETDLGEYIVQLRGERPAHIITPAIHLRRQEVGSTFQETLGVPYTDNIPQLVQVARRTLRQVFLEADIGISGVNFGVVEDGTLCLLTNEGNGRMVTTLPRIHIALMGIERLVPTREDLALMLQLLPRSATGQKITVYTSLIRGPSAAPGTNPRQRHLILIDNGRSALRDSPLQGALCCIRCGACLNVCPIFREIGGHGYVGRQGESSPYPGPIGSVLSPGLFSYAEFGHLARASTLCGACKEDCPVDIDLPKLLLRVRAGTGSARAERAPSPNPPTALSLGLYGFTWLAANPLRFAIAQRVAGALAKLFARSGWMRLPVFTGWGVSKDFPMPAARPFRDRFTAEPATSDARGEDTSPVVRLEPSIHQAPEDDQTKPNVLPIRARFAEELTALGGEITFCPPEEVAANVLALINRLGIDSLLSWDQDHLPSGLLSTLEAAGIRITHEAQPSIRAGLTGVNAAVAETGSLILMEGAGTPLSASLLPEIHVAVCSESDIYPSLAEALNASQLKRAPAAVLISGPSRTADIEMSLTIGVHGPGELYVICLSK
jgi:L-lactate dehydrogenase complex protein LldF